MEPKKPQPPERQVRIEIDNTVADGVYANLAFIASNNSEFIFDFARFLPGNTRGKVVTRIVLAPVHAKNFCSTLSESLEKYEKQFGAISGEPADKNIGFKVDVGPKPKDS